MAAHPSSTIRQPLAPPGGKGNATTTRPSHRRRWPWLDARLSGLAALGGASALLYAAGITARYPLAAGLRHPRVGWYYLSGNSLAAGLRLAAIIGLLFLAYALALRLALRPGDKHTPSALVEHLKRSEKEREGTPNVILEFAYLRVASRILDQRSRLFAVIVGGWLMCSAALLGAYPAESFDIFDYVFRGRMLVEYGASPLASAPSIIKEQPFYQYITWRGQVDTYGPLWEYASGLVAWVVHHVFGRADSHVAYLVGYRLLAIVLAGLCGIIITSIVRHSDPARGAAALLAWLWNPLLLLATAMGAHNDLVMMLAVLAALLLFQRRRWIWGLLALALAAHVKLTALLIAPVLGIWLLRRRGWRRALRDGAVALALAIPISWLLYAPLGGWGTLQRMLQERARLLINSPADLIYRLLQECYGWAEPAAWRVTTVGATLLFCASAAIVLAWLWWHVRRPAPAPTEALLWRGCVAVTLLYLLIGSFWFQHWYLLWVLGPAVLLPASRWTLTFLPAYCLGALLSNLASSFLPHLPSRPLSLTQVSAINLLVQVALLVCAIGAALLWPLVVVKPQRAALGSEPTAASPLYEMDDHDTSRYAYDDGA